MGLKDTFLLAIRLQGAGQSGILASTVHVSPTALLTSEILKFV